MSAPVKSPSFFDQHALLDTSAASLCCDFVRDMRQDFGVDLAGPRAWFPPSASPSLPIHETVLLGRLIDTLEAFRGYVLPPCA